MLLVMYALIADSSVYLNIVVSKVIFEYYC